MNFRAIEKLEVERIGCKLFKLGIVGTTLTRCTAKLRTDVLPHDALEATILEMTC